MPKLKINGMEVEVEQGTTVMQACEMLGIEVPRFCYHDKLAIVANCRMCLVEQKGAPKPVPSCHAMCCDGMEIQTDTPAVKQARQGVMEFLLANHPLDCPVCDQGGECDLQDQAFAHGYDRGRYQESKRAVTNKDFGPLIKTVMTRCIHCTRCIRFGEDIAGVNQLGLLGRGEDAEIGTFVGEAINSELSGNLVDVCPVGALTSKPYAFTARSWELTKTDSIDVLDAVGSAIRVDSRDGKVMRILPNRNEDINEVWISDKTRYAYDGIHANRVEQPYIRIDGELKPASWDEVLSTVAERMLNIEGHKMAALVGDMADCESIMALKDLTTLLNCHNIDCRIDGANYDVSQRCGYIMNTSIADIEKADAILMVGTFPRHEATMINARIRKTWFKRKIPIAVIGADEGDYTYPVEYLGNDARVLEEIAKGKHKFSKTLKNAEKPLILVGAGALTRADGEAIQSLCRSLVEQYSTVSSEWNGYGVIQTAASRVGALDIGFVPPTGGKSYADIVDGASDGQIQFLYLMGVDNLDRKALGDDVFVVYQGTHFDNGAECADVILPSVTYVEKSATFVNTEGRIQRTHMAIKPLGQAKEDWKIIRALSGMMKMPLLYNTVEELRTYMADSIPLLKDIGKIADTPWKKFAKEGIVDKTPFTQTHDNYYQTCSITQASEIMAQCSKTFGKGK